MLTTLPPLQISLADLSTGPAPLGQGSEDGLVWGCVQEKGNGGEGDWEVPPALAAVLPEAAATLLQEAARDGEFGGKVNSTVALRLPGTLRKVVLVGLGPEADLTPELLRRATGQGLRQAHALKAKQVAIALPLIEDQVDLCGQAIAEAAWLVAHQDQRFKSPDNQNGRAPFTVEAVTISGPGWGTPDSDEGAAVLAAARAIATGTILARELVAAPANVVTPRTLADTALALASTYHLEVEILDQAACAARGMGAFLGVAQASDLPPQFIHLTYRPSGPSRRTLAMVGKGVTFDSGGLNLKTSMASIGMMKIDMAGSAAVLGAAQAIAQLQPDVTVHFIVAATENMISGRAMHPGDILTASNHKTIEINNTDAEGRLTLADALVYAEKLEVDAIVDLATLTGACIVALGNDIAGLFSRDDTLASELKAAAAIAGEKIWQMPMEESYGESLSSVVADMKNTGAREGGSISAALFLQRFVDKTPWAHIDLAGPVWSERESPYSNKGATGYGVRTLVAWAQA